MVKAKAAGVVARRRSLPREMPLLVGRVRVVVQRPPVMQMEVWCPYCKKVHVHGWSPGDRRADHVEHRAAHCLDGSPFQVGGYYVGLDPAGHQENAKEFAAYDRLAAVAISRQYPGGRA